jgi:hypothetical protein
MSAPDAFQPWPLYGQLPAIPADGFGEVLLRLAGQPVKLAARSAGPVARGAEVWVEAAPSATWVVVRPVDH